MSEGSVDASPQLQIEGELLEFRDSLGLRLLAYLSLWAPVRALGYGFLWLFAGMRRPASLALQSSTLVVESRLRIWGREVRKRSQRIPISAIAEFGIEERKTVLGLAVGLSATLLGTAVGTGVLAEALSVGSVSVALAGLLIAALGIACDYGLTRGSLKAKAPSLWVRLRSGQTLRVSQVAGQALDSWLRYFEAEFQPPSLTAQSDREQPADA